MTQQQRTFLALALSFGLVLVYNAWVTAPAAEEAARRSRADAGQPIPPEPAALPSAAVALIEDAGAALPPNAAPTELDVPLRTWAVDRPSMRATFTSEGGGLVDAVLAGPRERVEQALSIADGYRKLFGKRFPPPPQVDMAEPLAGGAPQMAVSIVGPAALAPTQRYAVAQEGPGLLELVAVAPPYEVHKVFRWAPDAGTSEKDPSGYLSRLDVTVRNVGATPAGGELVVHTARSIDPGAEEAPSMFGGIGNESTVVCQLADDLKRERPKDEAAQLREKGRVAFVGIDQTYFLTAVWPLEGAADGECHLLATRRMRTADLAMPVTLAPGQAVTKSFGIFMGPKDTALLSAVAKSGAPGAAIEADPKLERVVDFGMWAAICRILIFFLRMFHGVVGNWGFAIIVLTIAVKVLLLPLTHKAMVSAEQMKKLSPRMEEIRKKFPDDRDRQNMEMMKLYQEAKVNPLGGCLPLLLQLPIWAALFTTLRTSYELYAEPFVGVWSDLTSKDPTYLLPLALGITMIVTQRLQPQMTMDKSQAFLMSWVMPIFFTAIMMNYPAGLSLYIFTNNLLSIVQQYALRKYLARGTSGGAR